MATMKKLSIRAGDAARSRTGKRDEERDALDEEIKRMRAQRLRLDRHQPKRD